MEFGHQSFLHVVFHNEYKIGPVGHIFIHPFCRHRMDTRRFALDVFVRCLGQLVADMLGGNAATLIY
jgi:hypothetical protein